MLATRSELLAPAARRYDELDLPVSGLRVRFRSLSEADYAAFQMAVDVAEAAAGDEKVEERERLRLTRPRLIVRCLCDANGQRLLVDDDAEALAENWDAADSAVLFDRLKEFCGIERGSAERIAAAKKNSSASPVTGRSIDSRSPSDESTRIDSPPS